MSQRDGPYIVTPSRRNATERGRVSRRRLATARLHVPTIYIAINTLRAATAPSPNHHRLFVERLADVARAAGAEHLEVLITSPGRQAANGDELLEALDAAAGCPARVLKAVEKGRLAFAGAIEEAAPPPGRVVAVVDVGGGSAPPSYAIAVGGSARAAKRMVGARLGPDELERALTILTGTPTKRVAAKFAIDAGRIRTLAAGIVLLTALQARLGTPLRVVRGGLREGALADLAARRAAAA